MEYGGISEGIKKIKIHKRRDFFLRNQDFARHIHKDAAFLIESIANVEATERETTLSYLPCAAAILFNFDLRSPYESDLDGSPENSRRIVRIEREDVAFTKRR